MVPRPPTSLSGERRGPPRALTFGLCAVRQLSRDARPDSGSRRALTLTSAPSLSQGVDWFELALRPEPRPKARRPPTRLHARGDEPRQTEFDLQGQHSRWKGRAASRTPGALPTTRPGSGYPASSPPTRRSFGHGSECQRRVPVAVAGKGGEAGRDHRCLVDRDAIGFLEVAQQPARSHTRMPARILVRDQDRQVERVVEVERR
jgi:hypothetical protein